MGRGLHSRHAGPRDVPERVPEDVVAQAKASFSRRTGGDLAALVVDSLVDQNAPAADHQLRFEHPQMGIDVDVSATASGSNLAGHVRLPVPLRVQLELDSRDTSLLEYVIDGAFSFQQVPHGVIRLNLIGPTGTPPIHTDWFRV